MEKGTKPKLVITTINPDAFRATGHVMPSSYILDLSEDQIKFLNSLVNKGESVDTVFISATVNSYIKMNKRITSCLTQFNLKKIVSSYLKRYNPNHLQWC